MLAVVISAVAPVVSAIGTFVAAYWVEILIACACLFMLFKVVRHGKRGTKHPQFEWAKLLIELLHVFRHPNPISILLLVIGMFGAIFGGHSNDHHNDGPPMSGPTQTL
ncbi:hypothetical protein [Methylobacterium sp. A54F]